MAVHYSLIYDPLGNEEHRGATWGQSEGHWVQYCGYGREECDKDRFRNSMNVDNPLWATTDYDKEKKNEVYPLGQQSLPLRRIGFVDTCFTRFIGDETAEPEKQMIDSEDRENRVSRNFANMMCDYAEKCGPNEKRIFFKKNGRGMKWVSNEELMVKLGLRIEGEKELMKDSGYIMSLSDVSVRNFPRRIFESFYERYTEWFDLEHTDSNSAMNVEAKTFVPGQQWMPLLSRSSPQKICGVYKVNPPLPQGKMIHKRPKGRVNSNSRLCWEMKNDSDEKLKAIEKKLELLIGMNCPVVEAKAV
jgi:hypothetical protein